MPKSDGKRITIGLMTNMLDYEFQTGIRAGVQKAAEKFNLNSICFSGADIKSPILSLTSRNTVYDFVSKINVDALIIIPSSICGFLNKDELYEFIEKFRDIPSVSIGMHLDNITSIVLDNENVMKKLTDHMIEVHGYRNILYFSGPANNLESNERYEGFKKSLSGHGITLNPDDIKFGNFYITPAYDIMKGLLNGGRRYDAVIAANDNMALGIIEALQENEMIIPDDMAVTGFDDIYSARSLLSPLTTIRQPLERMTGMAVEFLLKKINGESVQDLTVIHPELVIRKSCGCRSSELDNIPVIRSGRFDGNPDFEKITKEISDEIYSVYSDAGLLNLESCFKSFIKALNGKITDNEYIVSLEKSLKQSLKKNFIDPAWESFLSISRKKILPYYFDNTDQLLKIENLIHQSRVLVKEYSVQTEMNNKIVFLNRARTMQQVLSDFVNLFDIDALFDKIAAGLPRIGVQRCYLSLYVEKEKILKEAKLFLAFDANGRINLEDKKLKFPIKYLFPEEIDKSDARFDFIVESLFYEKEQLGIIVLEVNPIEGILITALTDQIQSTIKSSMLIREAMEKEKELETAINALQDNHTRLELAYKDMKENKEKLLISEKMASLGRLTSGIAHEINTPIATVRAALLDLTNLIKEEGSCFPTGGDLDDHKMILEDMMKAVTLADKAIEKAASFIKSIKSQTREMPKKDGINFNLIEVISEAILLIGHILKHGRLSIEFNHPDFPVIMFGHPGRISQVITNLVTNAADAMEDKKGETIRINLTVENGKIYIRVIDKGGGIPESIRTKIFDPLFTTKPFGKGTGLGLTIVHDIVCGEFGGSIEIESHIGSGTTFILVFEKIS